MSKGEIMFLKPTVLKRALFFMALDALVISISLFISFWLRFDLHTIPEYFETIFFKSLPIFILIRLAIFTKFRLYLVHWRYFSLKDFANTVIAAFVGTFILSFIVLAPWGTNLLGIFPRSALLGEFFFTVSFIIAIRFSRRGYFEVLKGKKAGESVLIVGVTHEAEDLVRQLSRDHQGLVPVAFLDHDVHKKGSFIHGLRVYSWDETTWQELAEQAIIADSLLERDELETLCQKLRDHGIWHVKKIQPLLGNRLGIRDISIEDLLARHPRDLDTTVIRQFIEHKTILITGGGGSIGSEIARQCQNFGAKFLILVDHSEYNLYAIGEEITHNRALVLLDVTQKEEVDVLIGEYQPDIIIHAAAYKHVPLVEANVHKGIMNNIIGTKNVIDLAMKHGVKKCVLISTDKAVRPTNVMGTTKRICELYAQNINADKHAVTEIVAVRFGNVLGSSGSVIPKFKAQIEAGGPVTVTHPDMTRYFMMIPEACELVLQAASLGQGGEIFILDMGKPVKIADLAKKMVELYGDESIEIVYSGLRPGEKLFEELLLDEAECKTRYESIFIAHPTPYDIIKLQDQIATLLQSPYPKMILQEIVPEATLSKDTLS